MARKLETGTLLSPEPRCPVQSECGGCPLLGLSRAQELEAKVARVRRQLDTIGVNAIGVNGIGVTDHFSVATTDRSPDVPLRLHADHDRLGYRNRLRMQVIDGRANFFNQAKRDGCVVLRPELWSAIEHLRSVTGEHPELLSGVDHVEVRVADSPTNRFGLSVSAPIDADALADNLGPEWQISHPDAAIEPTLTYRVGGSMNPPLLEVPLTAFVQVNSSVNRRLTEAVVATAETHGCQTFLDLFCGAGNFAVPLSAAGLTGVGIDSSASAIDRLREVVPDRIEAIAGDVVATLGTQSPADLIVVDGPRAGLRSGHEAVVALARKLVVLVGCRVPSFSRDLERFIELGLTVEAVDVFDMFPGTEHIETLATLRAPGAG